ncbi:MAG: FeoB-associated Cys-rich membrane protein [Ruminococcaceae bacterium]|nr:FeoB-associated Cys-rich membrane protein [Oscillospiraceae bacterium]
MLEFLQNNLATIITLLAVGALVALALFSIIKNKKAGKSSCGCNCKGCPNAKYCNKL